jgi:hypothetical protein
MELYRTYGGKLALTWSRKQAEYSLNQYWKSGEIHAYPTDINYANEEESFNNLPSNLWGVGMMLAYYSKWGEREEANRCLKVIQEEYGPIPNLSVESKKFTKNYNFYPRYAAHVLYGLANYTFVLSKD